MFKWMREEIPFYTLRVNNAHFHVKTFGKVGTFIQFSTFMKRAGYGVICGTDCFYI